MDPSAFVPTGEFSPVCRAGSQPAAPQRHPTSELVLQFVQRTWFCALVEGFFFPFYVSDALGLLFLFGTRGGFCVCRTPLWPGLPQPPLMRGLCPSASGFLPPGPSEAYLRLFKLTDQANRINSVGPEGEVGGGRRAQNGLHG